MGSSSAKEHRTVTRVTTILESVAASERGLRLNEIAAVLDAPKSSVHGLARGLVAEGYLLEDGGSYVLGPAIGALIEPRRPGLIEAARPAMEELAGACGETVALCSLVGQSVVYLDLVESDRRIRYSAPLRERRPLYPTSAGKCFLAYFPERRRNAYLESIDADTDAAREELAEVRREGVAYNRGETVPDVAAVARPILVRERPVACLNVAGPMERVATRLDEIAALLEVATTKAAAMLS